MKAVRIHEYGTPDTLRYEDAPRPTPGAAEVLVKVHAVGLNPVDWKTRAGGGMSRRYQNPFPLILGWDISGVVEAVGPQANQFIQLAQSGKPHERARRNETRKEEKMQDAARLFRIDLRWVFLWRCPG